MFQGTTGRVHRATIAMPQLQRLPNVQLVVIALQPTPGLVLTVCLVGQAMPAQIWGKKLLLFNAKKATIALRAVQVISRQARSVMLVTTVRQAQESNSSVRQGLTRMKKVLRVARPAQLGIIVLLEVQNRLYARKDTTVRQGQSTRINFLALLASTTHRRVNLQTLHVSVVRQDLTARSWVLMMSQVSVLEGITVLQVAPFRVLRMVQA